MAVTVIVAPARNPSPRAARTRAALVAAGFDLLAERPIDAIPIDDLVAKAGVAKGSFFNHFADKHAFAAAIAAEVRGEIELRVSAANHGVTDPVARIAGGMRVAAEFALTQPKRATVMFRSHGSSLAQHNPLNRGLRQDLEAAAAQGLIRPEASATGVLYWLGLCHALMLAIVEDTMPPRDAEERLHDMLVMGLTGLGVDATRASEIARRIKTDLG